MLTLPAGEDVLRLIACAYDARLPVLLVGKHGIGKSELLKQAAERLGIGFIARDLSLMEPPDLAGIPIVMDDGRTHYAAPAFLPVEATEKAGLIVFEEFNRCQPHVRGPCFELLTRRTLNDYRMPRLWLVCAAINPFDDDYEVDQLDPALESRFLTIHIVPCVNQWVKWAKQSGIHSKVIEFVELTEGIFEDPLANPRAWKYVSDLLTAVGDDVDDELLLVGLAGLVDEKWARAFRAFFRGRAMTLSARQIVSDYRAHRQIVEQWRLTGQMDSIKATLTKLKRYLSTASNYDAVLRRAASKRNVRTFFSDLPSELKVQLQSWLKETGYDKLTIPQSPLK